MDQPERSSALIALARLGLIRRSDASEQTNAFPHLFWRFTTGDPLYSNLLTNKRGLCWLPLTPGSLIIVLTHSNCWLGSAWPLLEAGNVTLRLIDRKTRLQMPKAAGHELTNFKLDFWPDHWHFCGRRRMQNRDSSRDYRFDWNVDVDVI